MKKEMQEKLALFSSNAQAIRNEFSMHDTLIKKLAALLYALDNKQINTVAIKNNHTLIKNNTGIFSMFRGSMGLCVAAMLSLKDDPEELFAQTITVYEMLRSVKFRASDYLVVAAAEIALGAKPAEFQKVVDRTKSFYDGMKAYGFFRTGQDDYIYSAMLGLSSVDVHAGTENIDKLFRQFKPEFRQGNSVQALAQILVLSGEHDSAVSRIVMLKDAMKRQGIRLDRTYTLPALGVLALLPVDIATIVNDIYEVQESLQTQKGFGAWSVSKQALLLFSSAIVSSVYSKDIETGAIAASVSTSIASIVIAQHAALVAAMSASTAATAAASSS